jgi:DNA-binding CsgD family transcriptional regulator
MFYNEYVKKAHLDDGIMVHHRTAPRQMRWLFVNRSLEDQPFSERDRRLMTLLNVELARWLGKKLARFGEPTVTDLSPRQRDVLVCLMEGDSEKQVARRLNISQHTVHDYVKMLHVRFGVRSRGELLARCRAFWPFLAARHDSSP